MGLAIDGPRGVPVSPDSPATSFPIRWHAKLWHELHEPDELAEFDRGGRQLLRPLARPSHEGERTPSQVGQLLIDANRESLNARYRDGGEACPPQRYAWGRQPYRLSAVEGLSAIACLDYQSCEYRGWRTSDARRFLDALQAALIRCLPGYREAPGHWTREEIATRAAGIAEAAA